MEDPSEPDRLASADSGSPEEEEDGEREPLLSRIAWAHPRRGAPGSAVRLLDAAGEEGAAGDEELPLPPGNVGVSRSSPADLDRSRPAVSGATRPCPTPRAPPGGCACRPALSCLPRALAEVDGLSPIAGQRLPSSDRGQPQTHRVRFACSLCLRELALLRPVAVIKPIL
uniref:Testis cDNA, clone: QtsA-18367, similar to human phosphatidylinositol 4-kinase type-II beta (PI4K2B),mRNA, RefSeq: NM_018323.2 n=1 Tax=Macaca fascicularis TaxID=9541 RepID=Q4R6C0_MACFA|nr:unnamed protein product [Macaca fascicularis]